MNHFKVLSSRKKKKQPQEDYFTSKEKGWNDQFYMGNKADPKNVQKNFSKKKLNLPKQKLFIKSKKQIINAKNIEQNIDDKLQELWRTYCVTEQYKSNFINSFQNLSENLQKIIINNEKQKLILLDDINSTIKKEISNNKIIIEILKKRNEFLGESITIRSNDVIYKELKDNLEILRKNYSVILSKFILFKDNFYNDIKNGKFEILNIYDNNAQYIFNFLKNNRFLQELFLDIQFIFTCKIGETFGIQNGFDLLFKDSINYRNVNTTMNNINNNYYTTCVNNNLLDGTDNCRELFILYNDLVYYNIKKNEGAANNNPNVSIITANNNPCFKGNNNNKYQRTNYKDDYHNIYYNQKPLKATNHPLINAEELEKGKRNNIDTDKDYIECKNKMENSRNNSNINNGLSKMKIESSTSRLDDLNKGQYVYTQENYNRNNVKIPLNNNKRQSKGKREKIYIDDTKKISDDKKYICETDYNNTPHSNYYSSNSKNSSFVNDKEIRTIKDKKKMNDEIIIIKQDVKISNDLHDESISDIKDNGKENELNKNLESNLNIVGYIDDNISNNIRTDELQENKEDNQGMNKYNSSANRNINQEVEITFEDKQLEESKSQVKESKMEEKTKIKNEEDSKIQDKEKPKLSIKNDIPNQNINELDNNTEKQNDEILIYTGSFSALTKIFHDFYLPKLPEVQKKIFNIPEESMSKFTEGIHPIILYKSKFNPTLQNENSSSIYENITSIFALSFIIDSPNNLNINHFSTIYNDKDSICSEFQSYLNYITTEKINYQSINIDLYYECKDGKYTINKDILDILKKLSFKWVKLENLENGVRFQKMALKNKNYIAPETDRLCINNPLYNMANFNFTHDASNLNRILCIENGLIVFCEKKEINETDEVIKDLNGYEKDDNELNENQNNEESEEIEDEAVNNTDKNNNINMFNLKICENFDEERNLRAINKAIPSLVSGDTDTFEELNEYLYDNNIEMKIKVNKKNKQFNRYLFSYFKLCPCFESVITMINSENKIYHKICSSEIEVLYDKDLDQKLYMIFTNDSCTVLIGEVNSKFKEYLYKNNNGNIYSNFHLINNQFEHLKNEKVNSIYLPEVTNENCQFFYNDEDNLISEDDDIYINGINKFYNYYKVDTRAVNYYLDYLKKYNLIIEPGKEDVVIKNEFFLAVLNYDIINSFNFPSSFCGIIKP